jgi:hypothetical protein
MRDGFRDDFFSVLAATRFDDVTVYPLQRPMHHMQSVLSEVIRRYLRRLQVGPDSMTQDGLPNLSLTAPLVVFFSETILHMEILQRPNINAQLHDCH